MGGPAEPALLRSDLLVARSRCQASRKRSHWGAAVGIVRRDVLALVAGLGARDHVPRVLGNDEDDEEVNVVAAIAAAAEAGSLEAIDVLGLGSRPR